MLSSAYCKNKNRAIWKNEWMKKVEKWMKERKMLNVKKELGNGLFKVENLLKKKFDDHYE